MIIQLTGKSPAFSRTQRFIIVLRTAITNQFSTERNCIGSDVTQRRVHLWSVQNHSPKI
jgi:hypothetical protein